MLKPTVPSGVPANKRRGRRTVITTGDNYTDLARSLVFNFWLEIIQGLINKALEGGYQQTKLLLELCGLSTMENTKVPEKEKQQLCDVLLNGMQISMERANDCDDSLEANAEKAIPQDDNEKHTEL